MLSAPPPTAAPHKPPLMARNFPPPPYASGKVIDHYDVEDEKIDVKFEDERLHVGPIGMRPEKDWKPPADWYDDEDDDEIRVIGKGRADKEANLSKPPPLHTEGGVVKTEPLVSNPSPPPNHHVPPPKPAPAELMFEYASRKVGV